VAAIKKVKPDVVVLCTLSSLQAIMPQLETVLSSACPSSPPRRSWPYPYYSNKKLAKKIDELAKKAKVAVAGTGVNPGFVMDALPITLSGACERVDAIRIDRIQDASTRRLPFQKKIGSGLTVQQFQEKVNAGTVRHVD